MSLYYDRWLYRKPWWRDDYLTEYGRYYGRGKYGSDYYDSYYWRDYDYYLGKYGKYKWYDYLTDSDYLSDKWYDDWYWGKYGKYGRYYGCTCRTCRLYKYL